MPNHFHYIQIYKTINIYKVNKFLITNNSHFSLH